MSDLDEALRLARSLPAVNVNAWVDPNALLLARALIAIAADNERLRMSIDPRLAPCATCEADAGEPCQYVEGTPRIWWPEEGRKRIDIHRSRFECGEEAIK